MHHHRPDVPPGAQDHPNDLTVDHEGRDGTLLWSRLLGRYNERMIGDAHRDEVEHRPQVERQPRAPGVVPPRRVHEEDIGRRLQLSHGGLQQRPSLRVVRSD
jgi:hypothetical protein